MKSYFAKLAARATLASVPVTSRQSASKLSDPFDAVDSSTTPLSSLQSTKDFHSADQSHSSPTAPTSSRTEIVSDRPQLLDSVPAEQTQSRSPAFSHEPQLNDLPVESASQIKLEHRVTNVESRPPAAEEVEPNQLASISKLIPTVEDVTTHAERHSPTETIEENVTEKPQANEQQANHQREQLVLLRKADVFMETVFQRRDESVHHEEDADDERDDSSKRQTRIEAPTRLQPMRPVRPVHEHTDERPELVIGKLTVEVMPPIPAPVAPPQRVVVVRGTRSGRTALPSTRRFGLGQF